MSGNPSLLGPEPRPVLYPLPLVNLTEGDYQSCQGGWGPVRPSVDTLPCQASASGPSLRHPGPISFFPWACMSAT